MNPTPNPSLDEIFELMPLHTGRISLAHQEIVRRLQQLLPPAIVEHNLRQQYDTRDRILGPQEPEDICMSPAILTKGLEGKILVGAEVETVAEGLGGTYINIAPIKITMLEERIEREQQVICNWELAELVRGCLYPFLSGCVDEQGRRCWRKLDPLGYGPLRGDWAREYSGTQCLFNLVQAPEEDGLWD